MPHIRHLNAADDQAYARVAGYSYNIAGARIIETLERSREYGERALGIFTDEGALAAAMLDRRMTVNLNGQAVSANGIGMVASAPETRKRGLVRDMLAWHVAELHAEGVPLSILYPFQYRFYNRLGWGFGNQVIKVSVPPKEFAGHARDVGRTILLATLEPEGLRLADGYTKEQVVALMAAVYAANAPRYNLTAHRQASEWERMLRISRGIRYIYGWFSPAGSCEGYFFGGTRDNDYPTTLVVREMFASTPEGWQGLFWFLSCHDSHIKDVRFEFPARCQIFELLVDPRQSAGLGEGQMVRIVDVERLLTARGAAGVPDGEFTLRVHDELAPWNHGDYHVETISGHVNVAKLACAGGEGEPDVTASIDVLSQLAVGTRALGEMAEFGLVRAKQGRGYDHAAMMFPARPIWHLEYY